MTIPTESVPEEKEAVVMAGRREALVVDGLFRAGEGCVDACAFVDWLSVALG